MMFSSFRYLSRLTAFLLLLITIPGCGSEECLLKEAIVMPEHLDYLLPAQSVWKYIYNVSIDTNQNRHQDSLVRLVNYTDVFSVDVHQVDSANTKTCLPERHRIQEIPIPGQINWIGNQEIRRQQLQNYSVYSLQLGNENSELIQFQYSNDGVELYSLRNSTDTEKSNRLLKRTFQPQLAIRGQTYNDVLVLETQPNAFADSPYAFDSLCYARGVGLVYMKFKCCPAERIPQSNSFPNIFHSIQLQQLIK
jgi:hypothetical protein